MAIKKQEYYEGAALHLIARAGRGASIRYEAPFFVLNERLFVLLKYSTKGRSPWGFTFTEDEQNILQTRACLSGTMIGLICGSDGVAAFNYECFASVASRKRATIHIACYRQRGEHYEINGPDGTLEKKVAPSNWQKILEE